MSDGRIVTFYSYKGGTGRSMLLANVAWILAANGRRVLVIDWDLEAPGLHKYFQPFLVDQDLIATEGVIDFAMEFVAASKDPGGADQADRDWFDPYADMTQYAIPLEWDFGPGRLDYLGPGRQGPSYSARVNGFDWQELYEKLGGGAFLARARHHLKARYDYVLIDSRTGLSDTSGICTIQMPDELVICFTLNNQSVEGAAEVARSVQAQRQDEVRVLTVPMRIDNSEKEKLDLRRRAALAEFAGTARSEAELERLWANVEVLYQPFYAYEEILATFGDTPGRRNTILGAAERVTAELTSDEVTESVRIPERRRREVLATYEGTAPISPLPPIAPSSVFISYHRADAGYVGRLYDVLDRELGGGRVVMDVDLTPGVDWLASIHDSVRAAAVILVVIGPSWEADLKEVGDYFATEVEAALHSDRRVIPVLVGGARMPRELPPALRPLARRNAVELSDSRSDFELRRLVAAVELAIVDAQGPRVSSSSEVYTTSASTEATIDKLLLFESRMAVTLVVAVGSIVAALATVIVLLLR